MAMLEIVKPASPLFIKVTVCAALVIFTARAANVSDVGVRFATGAMPVPLKLTLGCAPVVLLFKISEPVRLPTAAGVKTMLIVQLAPPASDVPQLLVWMKSPVVASDDMESEVFPLLASVTVCPALELPTACEENVIAVRESVATASKPVPLKLKDIRAGVLLLVDSISDPKLFPMAVGLKTTLMVQLAPAASDAPQLLVWLKSPVVASEEIDREMFPLLVSAIA